MGANEEIRQYAARDATCVAVLNGRLARKEQRHSWYWCDSDAGVRQGNFEILDQWKANRCFCKNDIVDQQWPLEGRVLELRKRPLPPARSLRKNVQQDVGVHQRHWLESPRVIAMISSVDGPGPAIPTSLAKRLGRLVPSAFSITMLPSAARRNSTWLPGAIPRGSRTGLGMVTWPLLVTVLAMAGSPTR